MTTDQKILKNFIENHTVQVLQIIENFGEEEIAGLISILPTNLSTLLLSQMDRFKAARCLDKSDLEVAIKLIGTLSPSRAVIILRQLNQTHCDSILEGLSIERSKSLRQILSYPPDSVGAYLDPMVFTLQEDLTIGEALERIMENHSQVFSHIFILSRIQLLVGFIEMKDLIIHKKKKAIRTIMNPDPIKILADINIKVLSEGKFRNKTFSVLPVVDAQDTFLGVITSEIMIQINPEEKSLDRQAKQASMELGNLYQIGLSSLFRTATDIIWENKSK